VKEAEEIIKDLGKKAKSEKVADEKPKAAKKATA
jgi:hypothetical protein